MYSSGTMQTVSLKRRFACLFYDALLLAAVWFVAGFAVVGLLPDVGAGLPRLLFQAWLFLVAGVYFTWCWRRGGQTLAMKTWRIRLVKAPTCGDESTQEWLRYDAGSGAYVSQNWQCITWRQAWLRYGLAVLGLLVFGIGFVWALWDRDRQFLYDRLAGTRLVVAQ